MEEYLELNRANWNERAGVHAQSPEYNLDAYLHDHNLISDVVQFDRPRLGELFGLRGVHLQCHLGTDTISLARLGAQMTGLDLSSASLDVARHLANRAGPAVDFVESDVYSAVEHLGEEGFDLVYTGIGALCWLPNIDRWAQTVARLLVPGGRLFLREGHPVLWSIDEDRHDGLIIGYPYFETPEPMVFDSDETYTSSTHPITARVTHEWNHGIGEIVTALLKYGLRVTGLEEHRSVPWNAMPGRMVHIAGEYQLAEHSERVPLSYTLQAVKDQ